MFILFILSLLSDQGDGGPKGTVEQLRHYEIVRHYNQPDKVDASSEASARASGNFGTRYAALMVQMHRTFARGRGFEGTYKSITQFASSGGPKGASDHLKALAQSFKLVAFCKDCTNGRTTCSNCNGKKKVDVKCSSCTSDRMSTPSHSP